MYLYSIFLSEALAYCSRHAIGLLYKVPFLTQYEKQKLCNKNFVSFKIARYYEKLKEERISGIGPID